SAPSYRDPWERGQRCLLVMGGFYEPHVNPDGSRDPYFVHLTDREVFAVAGLWDRSRRSDGSHLFSCTLVTLPANALPAEGHNAHPRTPPGPPQADHQARPTGRRPPAEEAPRAL